MAYEPKLQDTIITDAGRHVFLSVGDGQGTLVYTRVILSSQKMKDQNGQELPDETVRAITSLSDDLKEGVLQVTPVTDNTITVTGQFSNKDQADDLTFSTIGWYARIDTTDNKGVTTKGTEYLIAITPTAKDSEILAAGSPDHRSSQIISAELDMALSNAAKVNMTVNEIGYVTRAELNVWETTVKDNLDKKLADLANAITVSLNGGTPVHQDANHNINLNTYDKPTLDKLLAQAGKGAGVNTVQGVGPDTAGNIDLSSKFYLKGDVDSLVKGLQDKINALTTASGNKDTEIGDLNTTITGLTNQLNDLLNRVKFLEQNAVLGKRFTKAQEADATTWESANPQRIAFIEDK